VSLDTFSLSARAFADVRAALLAAADADTVIAFAGRIPRGIDVREVVSLLCDLRDAGASLYVDSNSLSAEDLKKIRPAFIKPNEEEIAALYGESIESAEDAARAAVRMVADGYAERVMISLGGKGAAVADAAGAVTVCVPKITPISTIGAGDSTVAGMICAAYRGLSREESFRFACACGTAACLTEGTEPPTKTTVEELLSQVRASCL
jgi:fructose-1-phosphate kinase PfkB-like protein